VVSPPPIIGELAEQESWEPEVALDAPVASAVQTPVVQLDEEDNGMWGLVAGSSGLILFPLALLCLFGLYNSRRRLWARARRRLLKTERIFDHTPSEDDNGDTSSKLSGSPRKAKKPGMLVDDDDAKTEACPLDITVAADNSSSSPEGEHSLEALPPIPQPPPEAKKETPRGRGPGGKRAKSPRRKLSGVAHDGDDAPLLAEAHGPGGDQSEDAAASGDEQRPRGGDKGKKPRKKGAKAREGEEAGGDAKAGKKKKGKTTGKGKKKVALEVPEEEQSQDEAIDLDDISLDDNGSDDNGVDEGEGMAVMPSSPTHLRLNAGLPRPQLGLSRDHAPSPPEIDLGSLPLPQTGSAPSSNDVISEDSSECFNA